ncbi:unnamed protein product [Fusarium venenatum]|uniref:Uncharacterized protein n=1 Tax=Fusarium venenatum TaxID=56646 RepID=A0A2L2TYW6_9HYPO|nr:uncharacterized protein FVRRES_02777 [Fusarium venenatum]CEI66265.1 unnamed protein product [Fusarium venenatum]
MPSNISALRVRTILIYLVLLPWVIHIREGDWNKAYTLTYSIPQTNYIYLQDIKTYHPTAAYHSLRHHLRHTLNGITSLPHYNINSQILATPLLNPVDYLSARTFSQAIRDIYKKYNYLIISRALFHKPSGVAKGGLLIAYPCRRQYYANVFEYKKAQLFIVYAANIAMAVIAVLAGLHA